MHWRHTPRLDLGISHGKMFPEFRSQARGKAEDGARVRGREVEGGGRRVTAVSRAGDTERPVKLEQHSTAMRPGSEGTPMGFRAHFRNQAECTLPFAGETLRTCSSL
ncbi:hypothetical protein NQZ68_020590 [Dissostichus eleginoides]|nr:hypothetical protein NQZ68_020590 [Dissostichus eleginoides]